MMEEKVLQKLVALAQRGRIDVKTLLATTTLLGISSAKVEAQCPDLIDSAIVARHERCVNDQYGQLVQLGNVRQMNEPNWDDNYWVKVSDDSFKKS